MRIYLDQRIKGEDDKFIGEEIPCLVLKDDEYVMNKDGSPLVMFKTDKEKFKTLRDVLAKSLLAQSPSENISDEEKSKRFDWWLKIKAAKKTIDLTVDESGYLGKIISSYNQILITGFCKLMLEGKLMDKDAK